MRRRNLSKNKIVLVSRKLIMNKGKKAENNKNQLFLIQHCLFFLQCPFHQNFSDGGCFDFGKSFFFLEILTIFGFFAPHWFYLRRNLFGTSRITQNILTSFSFKVNDLIERDIFFVRLCGGPTIRHPRRPRL